MTLSRMTEFTAATAAPYVEPQDTFVMSFTAGWDEIPPEDGGRSVVPGDVVVLCVAVDPDLPVTGPPDWERASGNAFWKMVMPGELDPVFRAPEPVQWLVRGYAVAGAGVTPFDDSGSVLEWQP